MMMARTVMVAMVAGAVGIGPALAQGYDTAIVQQLQEQGYREISTERTWLGRVRIVAEATDGRREIVINPNNGEVLRDAWLERTPEGGSSFAQTGGSGGGSGSSGATSVASTSGGSGSGSGGTTGTSSSSSTSTSSGGSSGGSSSGESGSSGGGSSGGSSGGTSGGSSGGSSGGGSFGGGFGGGFGG
ncbi:hypothetical protein [Tabrizicola sp. M-4]|uniref:hypothetical protein n=1 Tax=Tabrizicola sp. M-4 TaxID=3055847 RepID=UPI003DA8DDDD